MDRCKRIIMKISTNVRILSLLGVMLIVSKGALARVEMKLSASEVLVGGTNRMSCVTSLPKDIYWIHFPAGSPQPKDVYAYEKMHSPYKDRFEMQINRTTGLYELVITRVELTDAGVYTCQENEGIGDSSQGQIIVIEALPSCTSSTDPTELIGPNSCNRKQENLTLTCSVSYRGNIAPVLEWKMVGTNDTVTQGLNVESVANRVTSHLTIPSQTSFDGSSFSCQIAKTQYNCTSDGVKIIYLISSNFTQRAMIGDTIECTANTNESCAYRWKWFKGEEDTLTASNNRTLIPTQPGNFRCEATCLIRKEPCTITAMLAYVEDGNATSTTEDLGTGSVAAIVVVVVISIVIILILIVVFIYCQRKRDQKNDDERLEQLLLAEQYDGAVKNIDDIPKKFSKMPFIDKGNSGEVNGPFTFQNKECACERILLDAVTVSPTKQDEVRNLGEHWQALDHRNVLKFYSVHIAHPALYIVMDYAAGGCVRKVLNSCTEDLELGVVKDWAMQIAEGMNYLHSKDIVHGHIKAPQILIMEKFDPASPSQKTLKIASYRLAMPGSGQSAPVTFRGMFAWMAPEVIRGEPNTKAGDVWSYGVTVWEILTRSKPHQGVKQAALIRDLSEGKQTLEVPERCPAPIRDILKDCWESDMNKRPTFHNIVSRLHDIPDSELTENSSPSKFHKEVH